MGSAPMTAKKRRSLKPTQFGLPAKKAYPLDTPGRARNALARVAQHGTPAQQTQVRAAVKRKYPSIAVAGTNRKGR